jgi:hypothetical protein
MTFRAALEGVGIKVVETPQASDVRICLSSDYEGGHSESVIESIKAMAVLETFLFSETEHTPEALEAFQNREWEEIGPDDIKFGPLCLHGHVWRAIKENNGVLTEEQIAEIQKAFIQFADNLEQKLTDEKGEQIAELEMLESELSGLKELATHPTNQVVDTESKSFPRVQNLIRQYKLLSENHPLLVSASKTFLSLALDNITHHHKLVVAAQVGAQVVTAVNQYRAGKEVVKEKVESFHEKRNRVAGIIHGWHKREVEPEVVKGEEFYSYDLKPRVRPTGKSARNRSRFDTVEKIKKPVQEVVSERQATWCNLL